MRAHNDEATVGIECEGLRKAFAGARAVDGVSFRVTAGEVLALLGPNGSGKTTTVRMLTTLTKPDSGWARVASLDVTSQAPAVRERIGVVGQDPLVEEFLTGAEYLRLASRLCHIPRSRRAHEVDRLLAEFELDDVRNSRIGTYSGGMRRRLDIAASFLGAPPVLFLDEPSTGLDPHSRQRLWDGIRRRAHEGASILLTTQYMEEADALADSIVVLAHGRVVAEGTPKQLKDQIGGRLVELTFTDRRQMEAAARALAATGIVASSAVHDSLTLEFVLVPAKGSLLAILQSLNTEQVDIADVAVRRPTLDEAFLQITSGDDTDADRVTRAPEVLSSP